MVVRMYVYMYACVYVCTYFAYVRVYVCMCAHISTFVNDYEPLKVSRIQICLWKLRYVGRVCNDLY